MNEILLEYYAGKSEELLRCESYLEDIRIQIIEDNKNELNLLRKRGTNRSLPANKKLEKELEDFFGFKKLNIFWQTNASPNAMTLKPLSFQTLGSKIGIGKTTVHIQLYEELVIMADLNARELMAVILHEIGHNFYYCPIMVVSDLFFSVASLPLGLLYKCIGDLLSKSISTIDDVIKKYLPVVNNVITLWRHTMGELQYLLKPLMIHQLLTTIPMKLSNVTRNPIAIITGYGEEKGADSFAAKYGYGADQISALHKMEHPPKIIGSKVYKTNNTTALIDDLATLIFDIISGMMLDPHPNNNQRAQSILKKLKNDLKTNEYPIEMKKDLEREISRMEKACNVVTDSLRKDDVKLRKKWYVVIDNITKGHSDIRETFNFYYDSFRF